MSDLPPGHLYDRDNDPKDILADLLKSVLGAESAGPPYTHTFTPPPEYDEDGNPIPFEPKPFITAFASDEPVEVWTTDEDTFRKTEDA